MVWFRLLLIGLVSWLIQSRLRRRRVTSRPLRLTRKAMLRLIWRGDDDPEIAAWIAATRGEPADLWKSCQRGDWMLSIADLAGVDRAKVVRTACLCAREAFRFLDPSETRPRYAIEVAEAWARGEASLAEVMSAEGGAWAVVGAAWGPAQHAAAAAANAAASRPWVGIPAAALREAAAAAAEAAHGDSGRKAASAASLARSADLVRSAITWAEVEAAMQHIGR
jgi:hypothetical protein